MSEGIHWLSTLEEGHKAARESAKLLFVDMVKTPG